MNDANEINQTSKTVALNFEKLKVRFKEARQEGAAWLVECRDLYDAFDLDAGVYFESCRTESEVSELIASLDGKTSDRILGIYTLARPVELQGPGLKREDWLTGCR